MRPIKFRGETFDGKVVYGDLLHYGKYEKCIRSYLLPDKISISTLPVKPESVALLVGYDADGKEIYEGDELITPDGTHIYAAICCHAKIAPAKDFDFSEEAKRDGWLLKTE